MKKYPKTYHLPWSETISRDDKVLKSIDHFENQQVIASIKMDGECTCMYGGIFKCHARSLDSNNHASRNWVKGLYAEIQSHIPNGWRIFGENLYATHSIHYHKLRSWFYVFAILNEKNVFLPWNEIVEWAELLNLKTVDVFYDGIWNQLAIENKFNCFYSYDEKEGYVVRLANSFEYQKFEKSVAKYVRANHVQTNDHWMYQSIIKNELEKPDE